MGKVKEILGVNDITQRNCNIWKALLAEFIGNMLLNLFGCGTVIGVNDGNAHTLLTIALAFGIVIFLVVNTIGHVSGAHVNPAVTAGMLVTGNISVIKGLLYVVVQCLGALVGSALLKALTPDSIHDTGLGNTGVNKNITDLQGFGFEFFMGFILVLVVFGVCDPNRPESKTTGALAIGFAVTAGHLLAVEYTGASMNPARSFGSALIASDWRAHWVFWLGPICGGIVAALLYKWAFAAPPSGTVTIIERYSTTNADEKEMNVRSKI